MFTIHTLGRWNMRTVQPMKDNFLRAKDLHIIKGISIIHVS